MRFLIIQHENDSPPGSTLEWFEQKQLKPTIVRVDQAALPPSENFDALIVLGGEMNVDQEDKFPWLKSEKTFISDWIKGGKPLLGICLGGQLIAEILGARVSRHPFWEIGWCDVEVTLDSDLPHKGQIIPAFQWHGYSFDIPSEAKLVVKGKHWAHQGFQYRNHVLAFQFHPEAAPGFVMECAEAQKASGRISETMLSHEQIVNRMKDLEVLKGWYFKLLDRHFPGR